MKPNKSPGAADRSPGERTCNHPPRPGQGGRAHLFWIRSINNGDFAPRPGSRGGPDYCSQKTSPDALSENVFEVSMSALTLAEAHNQMA